jgi:hypothetical protein
MIHRLNYWYALLQLYLHNKKMKRIYKNVEPMNLFE